MVGQITPFTALQVFQQIKSHPCRKKTLFLMRQFPVGQQCLIPFVNVIPVVAGNKFDEVALNLLQKSPRMPQGLMEHTHVLIFLN